MWGSRDLTLVSKRVVENCHQNNNKQASHDAGQICHLRLITMSLRNSVVYEVVTDRYIKIDEFSGIIVLRLKFFFSLLNDHCIIIRICLCWILVVVSLKIRLLIKKISAKYIWIAPFSKLSSSNSEKFRQEFSLNF